MAFGSFIVYIILIISKCSNNKEKSMHFCVLNWASHHLFAKMSFFPQSQCLRSSFSLSVLFEVPVLIWNLMESVVGCLSAM